MTYKDLMIEIANKCKGVLLSLSYDINVYKLTLYYEGDLFFHRFSTDEDLLYEESFHSLMNAGIEKLLFIEGFLSEGDNQ